MTSTPVSNLAQAQGPAVMVSKTGKLWIGILTFLFLAFHWHLVHRMIRIATNDANWSHILIIPAISVYYIHLNRHRLMACERRVSRWGIPFILVGIIGYALSVFPLRIDFTLGVSMIVTLFGILLLLMGPQPMRVLWFPIAFLIFTVKVPGFLWSVVTTKMQTAAAWGSVQLLQLTSGITGMDATLDGSTIKLFYGQPNAPTALNVAEACAGMRMLMAFLALGVALAFLFPRRWWQRLIMCAMAAPIAIFINMLRVSVLGWLHLVDPELSQGDAHLFIGMLMLIPAAGLLMLVGWCMDKIIIAEKSNKGQPSPVPFDDDPELIHIDKPSVRRGALLALAVGLPLWTGMVMLTNQLTFGDAEFEINGEEVELYRGVIFDSFSYTVSTALLGTAAVLFIVTCVYAIRKIGKPIRMKSNQMELCQALVGAMLLVSLLGQTTLLNALGVALTKKPLPLRHGIALHFPDQGGDWENIFTDSKEPKDIEDELGTREYFTSYWVNNAAGFSSENVQPISTETKTGPRLSDINGYFAPGSLARVHMAYYTGMVDTVPHVPERCWLAAGAQPLSREIYTLELSRDDYRPDPENEGMWLAESTGFDETVRLPSSSEETDTLQIKAVVFQAQRPDGQVITALYFFLANGKAAASSYDVRFSFDFRDRYSYYSKVELMFPGVEEPEAVVRFAEDMLSDLLPEIMACLPDWTEVQAGTYPEAD